MFTQVCENGLGHGSLDRFITVKDGVRELVIGAKIIPTLSMVS